MNPNDYEKEMFINTRNFLIIIAIWCVFFGALCKIIQNIAIVKNLLDMTFIEWVGKSWNYMAINSIYCGASFSLLRKTLSNLVVLSKVLF